MGKILVSGLINIETTLRVDGFPLAYQPVHYAFGAVNATVSGVGYNVAKALTCLGADLRFLSMVGQDLAGGMVMAQLRADGILPAYVVQEMSHTPASVIHYDHSGKRMIYVDLKDIQERAYPAALLPGVWDGVDLAVLCNINFSRPMLAMAREHGIPIATDVHTISDLHSAYDADFMAAADILFMSDERLPCSPEDWLRQLWQVYPARVIVIGLGAQGALLGLREEGRIARVRAVTTRPVVNTIGAGDSLFSAFVDGTARGLDPVDALRRAVVFASWKIGETGAAMGFVDAATLDALVEQHIPAVVE